MVFAGQMVDRPRASRARQALLATEQARVAHVQQLLAADVMIDASFVALGRKCGKPNCRCAAGEKHLAKYLSTSVGGRTRLTYVRGADEVEVSQKAERYRELREARAELMKLAARTAELADELQEALAEPYPKDARSSASRGRGRGRGRR